MSPYTAILTVFNSETSILNAINSILSQSAMPSELIIIDDCSTDGTFNITKELKLEGIKLNVIRNEVNLGVAYSRNFAVKLATTDRVIFFDDDDISLPSRASVHLAHLDSGAAVSFVSSSKTYSNGYRVDHYSTDYLGILNEKDFTRSQILGGISKFYTPASCMAINTAPFLGVNGFDTSLRRLEDADISIRLSIVKAVFGFSSTICVERFDFGKAPSPHEASSQKIILSKYRNFLSKSEFRQALFKIDIHDYYFRRKYLRLVALFLREIFVRPFAVTYIFTGFNRLKHDWSKK